MFGKAAPEGWILVAAGSRALLMCHLIRSRRLPQYLSFIGRDVTQPRPAWRSCRHICGRYGGSLSGPPAPDVMCDMSASYAPVGASSAFFLYLIPQLQVTGFAPRRAACPAAVSQKASSSFSLHILLIIPIFTRVVSPAFVI